MQGHDLLDFGRDHYPNLNEDTILDQLSFSSADTERLLPNLFE
jgi:hypothetical protein